MSLLCKNCGFTTESSTVPGGKCPECNSLHIAPDTPQLYVEPMDNSRRNRRLRITGMLALIAGTIAYMCNAANYRDGSFCSTLKLLATSLTEFTRNLVNNL